MTDIAILRGGDSRVFLQKNGISPANPYLYYGALSLDGPEQSDGEPSPVYLASSERRNAWDIVDEAPTVQELGTTDFTQKMDRFLADAWWDLRKRKCLFNLQVVIGRCQRPDDFTKWDSKIILRNCRVTNFTLPTFNTQEGSDNSGVDLSGSLSFRDIIPIRSLKFGERGSVTILAEVLDGLFNDFSQCGDCGDASDGCQKLYLLTLANSGSPGLSSQIVRSADGGSTTYALDIPTLGGKSGTRMAAVGGKLIVVSQADGAHHIIDFADLDAGLTSGWSRSTSGYVAGKSPRAIWSRNSAQTFIGGQGGYLYLLENPNSSVIIVSDGSLTTQDLNDIHGKDKTVVVVGGSNAVLVSQNAGESFGIITGPTVGVGLNAVWVLSSNTWFIGSDDGRLFYTIDGGLTWRQIGMPSGVSTINDINFVDDIVGYMSVQIGGVARVYRTTDSGYSWSYTDPQISGLLTGTERINVVIPCGHNLVAAAGRKTSGGDGILTIAE